MAALVSRRITLFLKLALHPGELVGHLFVREIGHGPHLFTVNDQAVCLSPVEDKAGDGRNDSDHQKHPIERHGRTGFAGALR